MIDKIINKDYSAVVDLKLAVLDKMGTIDYSVDEAMKMYTKAEAISMLKTIKDSYKVISSETEEVEFKGKKSKFMEVYVKEKISSTNSLGLDVGQSDKGNFFIIPLK